MESTGVESSMEETPIKVAVRIRPLLSKEVLHNHQECVRLVPNTQQIIIGKDHVFSFDFVFGKTSTQEEVYTLCIKPLLVSFTEGYNATVFAYGQTGSGKTYTIGGGHSAPVAEDERGIIPRAIQELFQHISENRSIDFHVKVSYIEVYKEELRDLLELETSGKKLHIREDEKGNTVIGGAKEFHVECADEVISLLESGNAARHTGTTQRNEHSSRSHAIFTISICQKQSAESQKNTDVAQDLSWKSVQMIVSKFHFVDLAGSERVTKTGNTGECFKESVQINSGLFALGNVISALGDPKGKSAHIPYRDAKITRILKGSLGGNAKTVMITCISPSSSDFDESLNSLKHASRAKTIRTKGVVNYNPNQDRIDEMELEIVLLREALQNQQVSNQCSHDLNQERTRIRSLEEQLAQLQVQCVSYRSCIDEAFPFLVDLNDNVSLKRSQRDRLQSWITMVQEVRKEALTTKETDTGTGTRQEPHHITILQLKRELKKCQAPVMEEEVFSQKDREMQILQNQIRTLLQENEEQLESLKETQETHRLQTEKMVGQQMLIDQRKEKSEKSADVKPPDSSSACGNRPAAVAPAGRLYSVPESLLHSLRAPSGTQTPRMCTSPAPFSLARVMGEFHARTQMILRNVEDQDKVLHDPLPDQSNEEKENTGSKKKTLLKHSINRTWTREQASLCLLPDLSDVKCQADKSGLSNRPAVQTDTTTGKDAQSVSRQYSLKITELEQEPEQTKMELDETQKRLQELESKELRGIPEKAKLRKEFRKKTDAAKVKVQTLEEQKKWLNEEMERILQRHQQLADLEEDLKKREAVVAKQEALLQEKSHLEIKKLRSSQALNKDSMKWSTRFSMLDEKPCDKGMKLQGSTSEEETETLEKIQVLQAERDQLLRRRNSVAEKLKDGNVLSSEEEHALFQLEEGVEALEAAIDYKSESIRNRQRLLRSSSQILSQSENNVIGKLVSLSAAELRAVLFKYFNKIVGLRESERKLQLQIEEQEMKVKDQENRIHELESALEHVKLQCDRQLTLQHKEHEKKLQLILHHFKEQDSESTGETLKGYEVKVQQLEKDLFFYKKTSRELKKKLKGLFGESPHQLLASTKYNSADDKASTQDGAEVAYEEFRLTLNPETNSRPGKIKETERTSVLRAQQNSYKLGEDVSKFGCNKECLSITSDDKTGTSEAQPSKSLPHLPSVIQRRENGTQFQGVTPVKLSRRELRPIPPSELSLRHSNLGAGVSFIVSDSTEMDKKSNATKT